MRNLRRALNPQQVSYMAPRQARYMQAGEDGAERIAKAINDKGEIYQIALYPDQELAKQAQADFDGFRTGTPAMEAIAKDMRAFYGMPRQMGDFGITLSPTEAALIAKHASGKLSPEDSQTVVRSLQSASRPQPKAEPKATTSQPPVINVGPPQETKQVAAEELKNEYVNKISGFDVQKAYDDLLKTKGILTDSALIDAAILGGGSLALTGIAGLGGADGGDAIGAGLLGAGVAAAPAIHNAVRNPTYRVPMKSGRGLVAAIAAGAGVGSGTSMLMDALGLTNQG